MFGISFNYKKKLIKIEDVITPVKLKDYGFENEEEFNKIEKKIKEDNGKEPSLFRLIMTNIIIIVILLFIAYYNEDYSCLLLSIIPLYFLHKKYKNKKDLYDSGLIEQYKKYKYDNREYDFISNCDHYLKLIENMEEESKVFIGHKPSCIKELNLVIAIWDYYYMQFYKKSEVNDKKFILKVITNYLIPNSLQYSRSRSFIDLNSCLSFIHGYGIITDKELYKIVQTILKQNRDLLTRSEIILLEEKYSKEKIGKYYTEKPINLKQSNKDDKEYQKKIKKMEITKKEIELEKINNYVEKNKKKYIDKLVQIYGYNNWRDCYINELEKKGISTESSTKFFDSEKIPNKTKDDLFANYKYGLESFYDVMLLIDDIIANQKNNI